MTKKRRLLSLLLCLWMLLPLFAVFAVPASAAGAAEMDASYVVDDLNTMGVDITKYPGDANNDRVEILKVIEFGYKSNRDFSEYGLYLYLYNPSGKTISGDKNCVQLAYGLSAGGTTSYIKYRLNILSHSTGSGYENVFWKVKVEGAEAIAPLVNQAARVYKISGVEILRPGTANATDYNYGVGTFTFTGYHKGCQSNDYSTLRCIADKLDVVELELHPAAYYSRRSASSANYSLYDEIFSVYFSVPNDIVRKYGNLDDKTLRGLEIVKGSYREATTNGMLTDTDRIATLFAAYTNDAYFRCQQGKLTDGTNIYTRVTANCEPYLPKSDVVSSYISTFLEKNIFKTDKTLDGAGCIQFAEWYQSAGKQALTRSGTKTYSISKDDIGTVQQYVGFWKAFANFFGGKSSTEAVNFDMIQRLSYEQAVALNASAVSEKFKITEADAEALKSFTVARPTGTTYVLHFAIRDCVTARVTDAGTLDRDAWFDYFDEVNNIGNSYYFEKTVFEDFDILELHYRNKENKLSVVPVSASPIDVTGGIPNLDSNNPNAKPEKEGGLLGWFTALETWIKVFAVIALFLLLFFLLKYCGGFFRFIWKIISAPFRLIGKGIGKAADVGTQVYLANQRVRKDRQVQREHDEDRAEAKIDRDRRRAREDRAEEKAEARSRSKENEKNKNEKENES